MSFTNQDRECVVTLSGAKGLSRWAKRSFASLRMTVPALVVNLHYRLWARSIDTRSASLRFAEVPTLLAPVWLIATNNSYATQSGEVGRLYRSMVQFHPELYRRSGSGKRGIHGPATVFKYPSIPA